MPQRKGLNLNGSVSLLPDFFTSLFDVHSTTGDETSGANVQGDKGSGSSEARGTVNENRRSQRMTRPVRKLLHKEVKFLILTTIFCLDILRAKEAPAYRESNPEL